MRGWEEICEEALYRRGFAFAMFLSAGTAMAASEAPLDGGGQASGPRILATNCRKTFSSGSGVTRFVWCFSNDGNIARIEHSDGLEHVRIGDVIEGFCLSSNFQLQATSLGAQANVGLNAPTFPGGNKVQHLTSNGVWRIEQSFAQSAANKTITVTMKLTNVSGSDRSAVHLTRQVDADMSNTPAGDVFLAAGRSVSASEPGSSQLELAAGTTMSTVAVTRYIYPGPVPVNDFFCADSASSAVVSATGDRSMGVSQFVPAVPAGASVTFRFIYRVSI